MEKITDIFTNIVSYIAPRPVRVIDEYSTVVAVNEVGEEIVIQIPTMWHYENLDKDDIYV
jgi:hypothetical protein